jgi:hypothetical protein
MGKPAAFRPRSFRLPICCLKTRKQKNYITINLPVALYECKTWFLALREEHRLRVFDNKVLRKVFGPKREELTGDWTKLHSGDYHNLYFSPITVWVTKLWKIRWAGHVARVSEKIYAHRVLMGTPEETDCLEDLCVHERILLKWLLNKQYGKAWTTSSTRFKTGTRNGQRISTFSLAQLKLYTIFFAFTCILHVSV